MSAAVLRALDVAAMAATEPPPVPWICEGLVVRGALTGLAGAPGQGKSMLAACVAVGVATGTTPAGMRCTRGGVVIVDAENGAHEVHRRVRALGVPAHGVAWYEAEGFDLRRHLGDLDAVIAEHRPALLVLDSYRSLWGGAENDADEAAPVLDALRNLVRRHDAGALLLHHVGRDPVAAYRGSSAFAASVELGFTLGRERDDEDRHRRFLECWKCRPAPEPPRRWLRLEADAGRVYLDAVDGPSTTKAKTLDLAARLLDALSDEPVTLAALARDVGHDPKSGSVRRALQALARDGLAEKVVEGWRSGCQPSRASRGGGANGCPPYVVGGTVAPPPGTGTDWGPTR